MNIFPLVPQAYYRKALALESLKKPMASYAVWLEAAKHCENTPELKKQIVTAKTKWLKQFKHVEVRSNVK
jgi:hypothetical protein